MNKTVVIKEFGGSDQLKIVDMPAGEPGDGQVRIAHKACGLNYIDVYQRTGLYPLPLPQALGMEAAGVIEAVGAGVTHVKVAVLCNLRYLLPTERHVEVRCSFLAVLFKHLRLCQWGPMAQSRECYPRT